MKHAPAPWTSNRIPGAWTHQDECEIADADGKPVASIGLGIPASDLRMIANARLIAAAPDLLAACRRLLAVLPDLADPAELSADIARDAEAAIAKAQGDDPQ